VSRAEQRPTAGFWPIGIRSTLPAIPVPIRGFDARLDLNEVFQRVYDGCGYRYQLDKRHPSPALSPADTAWAEAIVAGLR